MIGARWGVVDRETTRRYPCDEFVSSPVLEAWQGVTVRATPEVVWPWLTQVRIAPYGLPEPRVGDAFTTAGRRELGRIVSVDSGRQLTATILGAFMSYLLVPAEHEATRLLLKVVMSTNRLIAPALSIGDLIMARRQLLNLKELAER